MCIFRTFIRSADLVNGMAARLGIDASARFARDPEGEAQHLKQMITRCASCACQEACGDLQDHNDHLATAPAYCENSAGFAAMRS